MKYTPVVLAAFVSMAAAIPTGEMDRTPNTAKSTVGNVNDAAMERENLPVLNSLRSERSSTADALGDESRTGSIMETPIVTVDKSTIHQRDEQFKGDQKLAILPMKDRNLRQPNGRYERENKLLTIVNEDTQSHQLDENYKGEDMRNQDSIPSRLSSLRESA